MNKDKLKIEDFPEKRIIRINGLDYDYEFFRLLGKGGAAVGSIIEVIKRDDNIITLQRRYNLELMEANINKKITEQNSRTDKDWKEKHPEKQE